MTDKTRIKVAAALTALFLVVIAVVGIATHSDGPSVSTAATSSAVPTAESSDGGYLDSAERLIDDLRGLVDGEGGDDD